MITITKQENNFVFTVNGMHKLWAFKSQLTIPAENILSVDTNLESVKGWKGSRMPGTYIPSVLTAGTFYKEGNKIFWDAANMQKCIIVHLKDEEYQQLIIEVQDPADALKMLSE